MPLLRNNGFGEDGWVHLGTDDSLPGSGDIVVPFSRLLKEWNQLVKHDGRIGVVLTNVDRVESLALFLPRLALLILPFPAFTDGRAYSLARQLRESGYRGELRASGNILPDQLQFMRQVGFDTFDVSERFPPDTWLKASRQMSLAYQRGFTRSTPETDVWAERHREAEPWLEQPYAG